MSVERAWRLCGLACVAGLALIAVAWTVRAQSTTPETLDEAVEEVRRMREEGASNRTIAWYVTQVVDRRMVNGNSAEGTFYRYGWPPLIGNAYDSWAWSTLDRFDAERDAVARTRGRTYPEVAQWAWDLEYGHCGEAANISYYILRQAGVPVRMIEVEGAHQLTAIGIDEEADMTDPTTWGSDAWVVDGWLGVAAESDRMNEYNWLRGSTNDVTVGVDAPGVYEAFQRNEGLGNLNVTVTSPDGSPVVGASVTIEGPANRTVPTVRNGRASFVQTPLGRYMVSVVPPSDAGLAPGSADAVVAYDSRRLSRTIERTIRLAAMPPAPSPLLVRVFDSASIAVLGASVTLSRNAGSGITGPDGTVSLSVTPGPIEVTAERADLGTGHTSTEVSPPFEAHASVFLEGELSKVDGGSADAADAGAPDAGPGPSVAPEAVSGTAGDPVDPEPEGPSLEILAPRTGAIFTEARVTVRVAVHGRGAPGLTHGGRRVSLRRASGGTFEGTVELEPGVNRLVASLGRVQRTAVVRYEQRCTGGQRLCGSACVDTRTDPRNCGACENACRSGQRCVSGRCTAGASSMQPSASSMQPSTTTMQPSTAAPDPGFAIWVHPDRTTCCPNDHGGAPQYQYHGTAVSRIREGAIVIRRFSTEAEMTRFACGRHISSHYWARTYARIGNYHVTMLPCRPSPRRP